MEIFIFITELIGTAAFAISGAATAIDKKMDIFGVAVLGLTTALGGGMIRDLILGRTPPVMFLEPIYAGVAVAASIIMFIPRVRLFFANRLLYDTLLFISDTIGLGVFTVVGTNAAFEVIPDTGMFLAVFVGTLTGVGGGLMRDVFAGNKPYIFTKHIYAVASIAGSLLYTILLPIIGQAHASIWGIVLISVIRIMAARFHWKLPRAQ